jgi:hypothetical protein
MPTTFKHAVNSGIGTTPVDVLQIPVGFRATVIGCNIANSTEYDTVSVDVYVVSDDSTPAYYVRGLAIPPNSAVKIITNGEKLILPETSGLRIVSDTAGGVDTVISYVDLS